MRIETQNAIAQIFLKSSEHGENDVQGHDPDDQADGGNDRQQRNEPLGAPRPQVAEADEELVTHAA